MTLKLINKVQIVAQLILAIPFIVTSLVCYIIKGVVRTLTQITGRILAKPLGFKYAEGNRFPKYIIRLWRDAWYDEIGKHL